MILNFQCALLFLLKSDKHKELFPYRIPRHNVTQRPIQSVSFHKKNMAMLLKFCRSANFKLKLPGRVTIISVPITISVLLWNSHMRSRNDVNHSIKAHRTSLDPSHQTRTAFTNVVCEILYVRTFNIWSTRYECRNFHNKYSYDLHANHVSSSFLCEIDCSMESPA
jgi:hypothetical protein